VGGGLYPSLCYNPPIPHSTLKSAGRESAGEDRGGDKSIGDSIGIAILIYT